MFNVGPEKLILLFAIALVVLGPEKLPDAARTLGKVIAELRRMSGSLRTEVREALSEPGDALSEAVTTLRGSMNGPVGPSNPVPPPTAPSSPPAPPPLAPIDPSLN